MEAGMLLLILTPDDPLEALMIPDCNSGLCWVGGPGPQGTQQEWLLPGPSGLMSGDQQERGGLAIMAGGSDPQEREEGGLL